MKRVWKKARRWLRWFAGCINDGEEEGVGTIGI
jgi:hypothetical protein